MIFLIQDKKKAKRLSVCLQCFEFTIDDDENMHRCVESVNARQNFVGLV